jgi:L-2-hydroxyglutarate oxidase
MIYDIAIIGGGIIGLATALKLKQQNQNLNVILLEKETALAQHQTGNNSGVIHSGIYYKPGSLKAKNCIRGYQLLLDFCDVHNIKYELCGKLIVATHTDELPRLEELYQKGLQNGLTKIKKLTSDKIKEYEPQATSIAALWVPYTGIVDYTEVCKKYEELFTKTYQGEILLQTKVIDIKSNNTTISLLTNKQTIETKLVINTAGLQSDELARLTQKIDVRIIPFRGEYYELAENKRQLVKNLIYPVPDPTFPFLGVHFTRRINGQVEAGPNAVFAFRKEGYKKTDINLKELFTALFWPGFLKVMLKYWPMGLGEFYRSYNKLAFTKALQRLLPAITKNDLIPGGAGVRAQACARNGKLIDDFLIYDDAQIIHVLNTPSPAATASLAIGETIAHMAIKKLI